VKPSVLVSPTDFIAITDGINPSVKLDNVVVVGRPGLENIDKFSLEGTSPLSSYLEMWLIFILLNNIGLTYQSLNMRLVFNLFFLG
jgi:hypothetical protein